MRMVLFPLAGALLLLLLALLLAFTPAVQPGGDACSPLGSVAVGASR